MSTKFPFVSSIEVPGILNSLDCDYAFVSFSPEVGVYKKYEDQWTFSVSRNEDVDSSVEKRLYFDL